MPTLRTLAPAAGLLALLLSACTGPRTENPGIALFDGRSLDGWHAIGGGDWTVEDGVIRGTASRESAAHGLLVSNDTFADFIVTFDYRVLQGDSGFYFRVEEVGDNVGVRGFQVEIDDVEPGGLYETGGRAWVVKHTPEQASRWHRSGEWNAVRLLAEGPRIEVTVNDILATTLMDQVGRRAGHFALQLHGGQDMFVEFRNIRVQPL